MKDGCTLSNYEDVHSADISLDLTIDFDKQVLRGSVTHAVHVSEIASSNVNEFIVDTRNLKIKKVFDHTTKQPLTYSLGATHEALGTPLSIDIGSTQAGAIREVTIEYETSSGDKCPAGQFLHASQTADKQHPFYFTQCQAILCRSIIPLQDTPSRKVTYSARLTVKNPLTALMSAKAHGKPTATADGESQVFSFIQHIPVPSYLITIVAGYIFSKEISPRCAVWAERSLLDAAAWEFEDTERFLSKAESLCGPYVWERYDLCILPPSFPYGGMENPMLTFVTPTLIAGDKSHANVVIHEISHSWSGNLVTNATWSDFWLNEGFTVYTERAVLREIYGNDRFNLAAEIGWLALIDECKNMPPKYTVLRPNLEGVDPDDAFCRVPYEKGFALLLYLEQLVCPGEPLEFSKFLASWFDHNKYQTVTFEMFKAFFESAFPSASYPQVKGIDWEAWTSKQGMPPVRPAIDAAPRERGIALAEKIINGPSLEGLSSDERALKGFSSTLKSIMLKYLKTNKDRLKAAGEKIGKNPCAVMDSVFKFSETKDCDVKADWCQLCVELEYDACYPLIERFLAQQGRLKYCTAIYRTLAEKGGTAKDLAMRVYMKNKEFYHPVTAKYCGNIVGYQAAAKPLEKFNIPGVHYPSIILTRQLFPPGYVNPSVFPGPGYPQPHPYGYCQAYPTYPMVQYCPPGMPGVPVIPYQ